MDPEQPTSPQPQTPIAPVTQKSKKKKLLLLVGLALLLFAAAIVFWALSRDSNGSKSDNTAQSNQETDTTDASQIQGLVLDPNKNYGDKYANGILPVGDEKFVTDTPKKGYIYMCNNNFVPDSQAGAQTRGPWFVGTTQWDLGKKVAVKGSVAWESKLTNTVSGNTRTVSTNDLPNHVTGTFPVGLSDPAYSYDRNPNTIKSQSLTYTLSANPSYLTMPECMGGEAGVLLTGVALFNGFDAGGRDAGAWEVQDACEGHPQASGIYHYHTLSSCITDVGVKTVIGFALDGYPITGPKVGDNNVLTTDDLDECHGITSEIVLDGKLVTTYHYVMTQDFPYSVSCFRATATQSPGQHGGGQQQTGQQPPPPPQQ